MADEPKRFFDVAHPGKTAADASSKPVIVSNRPLLRDPMMKDMSLPEEPLQESSNTLRKPLQPSASFMDDQAQETNDDPQDSDQSQTVDPGSNTEPNVTSGLNADTVHSLIESKTYFVHVGTPTRSKKVLLALIPVGLIVAAAIGYGLYVLFAK